MYRLSMLKCYIRQKLLTLTCYLPFCLANVSFEAQENAHVGLSMEVLL